MKYKNYTSDWRILPYIISILLIVLLLCGYSLVKFGSGLATLNTNKSSSLNTDFILDNFYKIFDKDINNLPNQKIVEVTIAQGDTFTKLLMKNGVDSSIANKITTSLDTLYNLRKLYLGQQLTFIFDKKTLINSEGTEYKAYNLSMLRVKVDNFSNIEITNQDDEFVAVKVPVILKKYLTKIQGTIDNSFIATATKLGVSTDSILALTKHYSYDVDFQRDIKTGDEIELVFERYYDDKGDFSHDGEVIFSSLNLSSNEKKLNLYRYPNASGDIEYFSEDGSSIKKELLKTPLNVARISSGFGVRNHPVLGYSAMHKGVDFAASIGTPIFAAGNGVIDEIGHKGAYGKYVRIRHSNNYSTAYAHASSFARNLSKGSKVKQGEVIAYVGATGRTTGPHLHYEVLVNNKHVNPLKIKFSPDVKLSGSDLKKFNKHKERVEQLASILSKKEEIAVSDI
jgi:murein DD-endopeptidase MepM/ murein hydrolase activator NlpD